MAASNGPDANTSYTITLFITDRGCSFSKGAPIAVYKGEHINTSPTLHSTLQGT